MPRDPTKLVWSAEGENAVQLFRDLYFKKYPSGTPPLIPFTDPDRPYHLYSKEGFYRQYKAWVGKVETYKTFGTGVSDKFLKLLQLDKKPSKEEIGSNIKNRKKSEREKVDTSEDEESDDSYLDSGEEDCSLGSFDISTQLLDLQIDEKSYHDDGKSKKAEPKMNRTPRESGGGKGASFFHPRITECPGGNIAGTVPLLGGVDYEFYIADDGRSIMQKAYVPDVYLDAKKLFYRHGLNDQNVVVATVQTEINKAKSTTKQMDSSYEKFFIETTLVTFSYEVERTFYDGMGNKVNHVFEGKGQKGLLWAFFYLKKKECEEKKKTPARIDRELTRARDGDEDYINYCRNVARNTNPFTSTPFANQQHASSFHQPSTNNINNGAANQNQHFNGSLQFPPAMSAYATGMPNMAPIPYAYGATTNATGFEASPYGVGPGGGVNHLFPFPFGPNFNAAAHNHHQAGMPTGGGFSFNHPTSAAQQMQHPTTVNDHFAASILGASNNVAATHHQASYMSPSATTNQASEGRNHHANTSENQPIQVGHRIDSISPFFSETLRMNVFPNSDPFIGSVSNSDNMVSMGDNLSADTEEELGNTARDELPPTHHVLPESPVEETSFSATVVPPMSTLPHLFAINNHDFYFQNGQSPITVETVYSSSDGSSL